MEHDQIHNAVSNNTSWLSYTVNTMSADALAT